MKAEERVAAVEVEMAAATVAAVMAVDLGEQAEARVVQVAEAAAGRA